MNAAPVGASGTSTSYVSADGGVVVPVRRPAVRARLLCFPNAGAGASGFFRWARYLPEDIELLALRLPGRESRMRETPLRDMPDIVRMVTVSLSAWTDKPFAVFGYSMGALVAHEVVKALRVQGVSPVQFMAASFRAPHLPYRFRAIRQLDDAAFLEELRRYDGLPQEIRHCADSLRMLLPAIRADFEAMEDYAHGPVMAGDVPIQVVGGHGDRTVARDELDAWAGHTRAAFSVRMFEGGHFFVKDHWETLLDLVVQGVREAPDRSGGAP